MRTLIAIVLIVAMNASLYAQSRLKISSLTKSIYVYTTYNSYKGILVPANGLYVVGRAGVVLIDTPWDTTQFQPLVDSIYKRHGKKILMSLATHSHADRTAGLPFYAEKGALTYTTDMTDSISRKTGAALARSHFAGDTSFRIDDIHFEVFYPGRGHTIDNIVVWFPKDKVLYGGCLIKSAEATDLGYIAEADLKAWPTTIKNIQQRFPNPAFVIPGHDSWQNRKSLEHTLKLLGK